MPRIGQAAIAVSIATALAVALPAAASPARPVEASLRGDHVTVTFSDGQRCRATRPEGHAGGAWSSRLSGCSHSLDVGVAPESGSNILRRFFEDLTTALGARAVLEELGEVTVTDAAGRRHVLTAPRPRLEPR